MHQKTLDLIESKPTLGELTLTGNWEIREEHKREVIYVEAICTCLNTTYYMWANIASGSIKKCKVHRWSKYVDKSFGDLTILSYHSQDLHRNIRVNTICSCSNTKVFFLHNITHRVNPVTHCGCKGRSLKHPSQRLEIIFLAELKSLLSKRGLTLLSQYKVGKYFLDGFIPELNIALEYDEHHHTAPKQKKLDIIRQGEIEEILHCIFIRVPDSKTNQENINTVFSYINKL